MLKTIGVTGVLSTAPSKIDTAVALAKGAFGKTEGTRTVTVAKARVTGLVTIPPRETGPRIVWVVTLYPVRAFAHGTSAKPFIERRIAIIDATTGDALRIGN